MANRNFDLFKGKVEASKEKIHLEVKRLKYNKNPEYYKRLGLNEHLEPEEKREILALVHKDFNLSHKHLEIEEQAYYKDTTSKLVKIKGTSFYLEKYTKRSEEYVIDIPQKLRSLVISKTKKLEQSFGEKLQIKKTAGGLKVVGRSKELKKYILDLIYDEIM